MKMRLLTYVFSFFSLLSCGQKKNDEKFITWENFVDGFGKEMVSAEDVFKNMSKSGLTDFSYTTLDFTFLSNKKENLINLKEYLETHYPYKVKDIQKTGKLWELNGETYEIPLTSDILLYWALDMYKKGYEFDSRLDGYGGLFDPKNPKYPDFKESKAEDFFNKGIDAYNKGDLSGSFINLTLSIKLNPNDQYSYYSRAITRNELYTWKSALKDYDKAIEIDPNFMMALINRGGLKDENNDYEGAIQDYLRVIQADSAEIEFKQQAYYNLGNTKHNMKDENGACENWKKALELGDKSAQKLIDKYCK